MKSSCNWMWAAKLPDEGGRMYNTCVSLCACMKQLGISIDGGKDSLSMAAKVGAELVKSPGQVIYTHRRTHTSHPYYMNACSP